MTLGIAAWLVFGASAASSLAGSKNPESTAGLVLIVSAMVLFLAGGALAVIAAAGTAPVWTDVPPMGDTNE